ncbi:hypothetical protein [Rhizobium mesoamericanum]|uniref:hypothetical protein n=1 Tax=Rhizobium mesoamericanum TaxID=1079800 RepID=UPI00031AE1A0|nr:hypothetical protein [Rhizobium mesoamericanum]
MVSTSLRLRRNFGFIDGKEDRGLGLYRYLPEAPHRARLAAESHGSYARTATTRAFE